MKKFILSDKGDITFDGVKKEVKDLNEKFLNELFKESLRNNVEFDLVEGDPLFNLFNKIKIETDQQTSMSIERDGLVEKIKSLDEESKKEMADIDFDLLDF